MNKNTTKTCKICNYAFADERAFRFHLENDVTTFLDAQGTLHEVIMGMRCMKSGTHIKFYDTEKVNPRFRIYHLKSNARELYLAAKERISTKEIEALLDPLGITLHAVLAAMGEQYSVAEVNKKKFLEAIRKIWNEV